MEEIAMTLGERLRLLRESRKLSQIELAQALGIPNQSISNYERDYRKPPFDLIQKFADYYEVSMDYLLGREEYLYDSGKVKDVKAFLADGIFVYDHITLDEEDIAFLKQSFEFIIKKKLKQSEGK
ncbi:XRE family transcriptional regulator [Laceyella sacchari]|jgi:transcriptional regulator with XRE-family HTH domain|nr:XRE family transcriptional regulator [Laceyella sacchari]